MGRVSGYLRNPSARRVSRVTQATRSPGPDPTRERPRPVACAAVAKPTILHNPNCGTSRKVVAAVEAAGVEAEGVQYLKEPLDGPALRTLLGQLGDAPADLVRKDKRFGELGLDADDYTTVDAVVALLVEHPELMQRPVVRSGRKAVIARPATRALEFLGS